MLLRPFRRTNLYSRRDQPGLSFNPEDLATAKGSYHASQGNAAFVDWRFVMLSFSLSSPFAVRSGISCLELFPLTIFSLVYAAIFKIYLNRKKIRCSWCSCFLVAILSFHREQKSVHCVNKSNVALLSKYCTTQYIDLHKCQRAKKEVCMFAVE